MSEGAAYRRITAACLVKRFPALLGRIERGEIHLSALVLLRGHLTEQNVGELVTEAAGKTTREIAELLARRAPKPDVPSLIRKLPSAPAAVVPTPPATLATPATPEPSVPASVGSSPRARSSSSITSRRGLSAAPTTPRTSA
jgi:hypothetical protein